MRRLLLDANMPLGLRAMLQDYEVRTARQMGWDKLTNGALLAAAEAAGFDAMITADRSIRHQQNLAGRKIALIELTTPQWETIRDNFRRCGPQSLMPRQAVIPGSVCPGLLRYAGLTRRPRDW